MRIFVVIGFIWPFWSFEQITSIEADKQLLWEISHPKLKEKSFLFGTIHSNEKRVFDLADSVYVLMDKAKVIVLETDIFALFNKMDSRKDLPITQYDNNGNPYSASFRASKTAYGDENGMPQFLDAFFEEYCFNHKKQFFALESYDAQVSLLTSINYSSRKLINSSLNNFAQDKLMDLYLQGDIQGLDKLTKASLSMDPELYPKLISSRNIRMVSQLDSLLRNQNSFFCAVGAAHLGGSEGLVKLLRERGYRMRNVGWTINEQPSKIKKRIRTERFFAYKDVNSGLTAIFNGKPYVEKYTDGSVKMIYRELGQGNTYVVEVFPLDTTSTVDQIAATYIASPPNTLFRKRFLEDGTIQFEGLSDTYPEGLNWVRVQFNATHFSVIKVYGGNKFLHSDRPQKFFDKVWFE
ncbi:MAG: TraB/GumN family protein [Bacteroidetes bacterium]|nr:TraB/GumN family protein [Bacteroidota bacterium]